MKNASLTENLSRPHGFEPLRVEGALPDDLKGRIYRAGPGIYERFGARVPHPFEADGVVSSVDFAGDGRAKGAARVVESEGYLEEERAGKYLYGSAANWGRRVKNGLQRKAKLTGNTSVMAYGDKVFALMEGGPPLEMDPETLETRGPDRLGGLIVDAFSAHPHRVSALKTTFNFGINYDKEMNIDVYALPDEGSPRHVTRFAAPWLGLVHDFVATETHLLFVIGPAKLKLGRALLQVGSFADWFTWEPDDGVELIVIPLDDPERVKRFHTDAFWVWHFANGFADGGKIVTDLCHYPDLDSLSAIGTDKEVAPPRFARGVLDLETGAFDVGLRGEHPCEFPTVHPAYAGGAYTSSFAATTETKGHPTGILRVDVETGDMERWSAPSGRTTSEPLLAPYGPGEQDVWILTLGHDDERDASHIAVLDGNKVEDGPVAHVWFDHTVPLTFHGTFVPR
jgi:carotenoid cleavage dioxygenase-like enzyme